MWHKANMSSESYKNKHYSSLTAEWTCNSKSNYLFTTCLWNFSQTYYSKKKCYIICVTNYDMIFNFENEQSVSVCCHKIPVTFYASYCNCKIGVV